MHRFNRNVAREDVALLDTCVPRRKLAAVVNAAYYLEMPDLTDTLIKYTANNLEGKAAAEMAKWLEIPLKSNQKKKEAEDGSEGSSAEKRERN
ncbi:hypothetical protein L596_030068 [Steinernema carpocapsae]|uniref:SKP1 component dimerisation domain-containing protein n=1 Tax=Steinernema carpocapsae TaxID=34508 RepID=A0A4U5LRM4_STECR|nr:hypothetical protein L596_030068 [Steinernema carpocapsae]